MIKFCVFASHSTTLLPPQLQSRGLTLIGGKKLATTKILSEIQKLLPRAWRSNMRTANSIDAVKDLATIGPGSDIISLRDFDEELFASTMTSPAWLHYKAC
ncbi:hypothetical protein BDV23DRAFT_149984 [Aspergillus alliaceus]|uniref:Uncharacterized protein n=1 Tax=Petromyces alliaceus TaxID=209559 RepID=A0A5N7CFT8_PETAA|nr:hypothetical protein BDV23DRAFT_149984 [Aspergillus alliaceus]